MSRKGQVFRNAGALEGLVFLNYARSKSSLPDASTIDNMVPRAAMDALTNGDPEPFYKVEAIDFPAKGSGGVYEGSFFKSFINVTKERPIPGSKRGHEWVSRGNSDFYTVGGKIDSLDNGKTGTAFLKIYIPPKGDTTDNTGLIRDAKANMVHFSLVTRPDYNVKAEKDEMGNPVQVRHFTASAGAERNDAMEYGGGAMTQVVNSQETIDFDLARSLIAEGKFDRDTRIEGSPLQNGKVYRSALRSMISRANGQELPEVAELISLIDKSKNNGGKSVDKQELIETGGNMLKNAQVSLQELAKAGGMEKLLRNAEDEANAETVKALNAKLGVTEKPLEKLDAILAENKVNAEATVENAISDIAGPKMLDNPDKTKTEKIPNAAHDYAAGKCKGLSGEALKNAIEGLKKDRIMIALNGERADGNSGMNRVVAGGKTGTVSNDGDGVKVHKVGGK